MNLVAAGGRELEAGRLVNCWPIVPPIRGFARMRDLPDDTRLWAALQAASGGPWAGCVYDVDRIIKIINAGLPAINRRA